MTVFIASRGSRNRWMRPAGPYPCCAGKWFGCCFTAVVGWRCSPRSASRSTAIQCARTRRRRCRQRRSLRAALRPRRRATCVPRRRVDQDIEAPRRVAPSGAEPWDPFDDDRREMIGDRKVIVGGKRPLAELRKAEPGDPASGARHDERTPLDGERHALRRGLRRSIRRKPIASASCAAGPSGWW